MKTFIIGIGAILTMFFLSFAYSYQKTAVVLIAYEINVLEKKQVSMHQKKQKLLADFYKNTALDKINGWAEGKKFTFPAGQNVVQVARKSQGVTAERRSESSLLLALVEKFLGFDSRVEARQDR